MPRFLPSLLVWSLLSTSAFAGVDFGREVLPILSDKCFHCHGPDEKARKAGLRLDTRESAFRQKKNHTNIIPGKSAESMLYQRLISEDDGEKMPPPEANRALTPKQIDILKRWIDEGAKWGEHWAYVPVPKQVPVPDLGAKSPIDAFVQKQMKAAGLQPLGAASKESWLRRVSLDLTGLPPTLGELDAFLNDSSAQAYEKAADRLLATPRFGERMATTWLDIARFADTHGYQSDRFRAMGAYREWVIKAFNQNLSFDQFVTQQLAGDLIPNPTRDSRLATAFNRLHMQNEEGGIVEEEFRVAYVVDRVNTFGTAFLGQTLECCRCHDHKYDPISMKDFYSLFAFFQNIDEAGQTPYFGDATPVPTVLLASNEQEQRIAELRKVVEQKHQAWEKAKTDARKAFANWEWTRKAGPAGLVAHYPLNEATNRKLANSVDKSKPGQMHESPKKVPGRWDHGFELDGENGFEFPGVGHFKQTDPFSFALWMKTSAHIDRAVVIHHSRAPIDAGSRGYEVLLENGHVAVGLHHMWPGDSLKVQSRNVVPLNQWCQLTVTYDGSGKAAGVQIYLNGQRQEPVVIRDGLWKDITYNGGEPNLAIGYRFRDSGFKGGTVEDFRVYNRALTPIEVAQLAGTIATTNDDWFAYFLNQVSPEVQKAYEEWRKSREDYLSFYNKIPEAMVMREMPKPKPAFILKRGQYDSHGNPVTANTPEVLPPMAADLPHNRLGLAKWLTAPDQPLFARVTVNRFWQQMFGKGLVETSDNFGSTGTPPTHPELLDWLARDFSRDWDVKRFLKQIALSDVYRRSTRATSEMRRIDPYNQYLAYSPARRLSAEMLRDQALFASGLLVEKIGGPSVYPYQPEGLWNEAMGRPNYPQSTGENLYRRSIYTVWKRTAPHPQLTTFDAADRSVCTARRQTTNTPLQALALLNDTQYVEAARVLGEKMLQHSKDRKEQLRWMFRTLTARFPNERELQVLTTLWQEQYDLYAADLPAAEKLLQVGERKADAKIPPAELAASTAVCLAMLSHDEAVHRR